MSQKIKKNASLKAIREAFQQLLNKKQKKKPDLDQYFGKIQFDVEGLKYQKKVRNEWL